MVTLAYEECCTGCGACAVACPHRCIAMVMDENGFTRPVVNNAICVSCGICTRACPLLQKAERNAPAWQTWGMAAPETVRSRCSSGGAFLLLAQNTLNKGGSVFGAAFDDQRILRHCRATNNEELTPLLRSKYLQSEAWPVYAAAKIDLQANKPVLFCGTPCQVAGLKGYLGALASAPTLLCAAVACHGVPSPGVFADYCKEKETKQGSEMTEWIFRNGFTVKNGKARVGMKSCFADGSCMESDQNTDLYMQLFLKDIILRPSCYKCTAKDDAGGADLLLGDFWGVEKVLPLFDRTYAVSLVAAATEKGKRAVWVLQGETESYDCTWEQAVKNNPCIYSSVKEPPEAKWFWAHRARLGSCAAGAKALKRREKRLRWEERIQRYLLFWKR